MTLLPQPTDVGSVNGSDTWVYKFAEGTRLDCYKYANGSTFGSSSSCADVAKGFGVNDTELVQWNPSLAASCTLDGGLTYCVQYVRQNGTAAMTNFCTIQDMALYGMRCDQFLAVWGMEAKRLNDLNPGVGENCENWISGRNYCVAAPHYRPATTISTCNKFAIANNTNGKTLSPSSKRLRLLRKLSDKTREQISRTRVLLWKRSTALVMPALSPGIHLYTKTVSKQFLTRGSRALTNTTGTGMQYGYDYCVSIPGYKPTYTSYINPNPIPTAGSLGIAQDEMGLMRCSVVRVLTRRGKHGSRRLQPPRLATASYLAPTQTPSSRIHNTTPVAQHQPKIFHTSPFSARTGLRYSLDNFPH